MSSPPPRLKLPTTIEDWESSGNLFETDLVLKVCGEYAIDAGNQFWSTAFSSTSARDSVLFRLLVTLERANQNSTAARSNKKQKLGRLFD